MANEVLLQCEAVVIARRLLDDERLEYRPWAGNRLVLTADLLDGDDRLVAQEAIGIVERRDERIHGALGSEQRERRRNVPADPHLFTLIEQGVRERVDHRLA